MSGRLIASGPTPAAEAVSSRARAPARAIGLLPGRVGLAAGMSYGFSFGLGGLGAAALGKVADLTSIATVYRLCAFLLLLGPLTAFLPRRPGAPSISRA